MTTSLFFKNTDLSADYAEIAKGFTSNTFDYYDVITNGVRIKHQLSNGIDCFYVQAMQYEYNGCYVGTQVNYGKYDKFEDAASCALRTLPELAHTPPQAAQIPSTITR